MFLLDNIEIYKFIEFIKNSERLYGKRKSVFVTDTPNQVVFSNMLNMFKQETMIELTTVSTLPAALKSLNLSEFDLDIVNQNLNDLKSIIS